MRWTIGRKLVLGFGTIILLMIASTLIAYINARHIDGSIEEMVDQKLPAALCSQELEAEVNRSVAALRGYVLLGADPVQNQRFISDRAEAWVAIDRLAARLSDLSRDWTSAAGSQQVAQMQSLFAELRAGQQKVEDLAHRGDKNKSAKDLSDAQSLMESATVPVTRSLHDLAQRVRATTEADMRQQTRELQAADNTLTLSLVIVTVIAVLTAAAVAGLVSRKMTSSVQALARRARDIASGNLTGKPLGLKSNDEIGELSQSFDTMVVGLRDLAAQVHSVTENVNSAATQIASSSQQQSSSTREQAAAVQQITSTMQEISQAGNQIVEQARSLSTAAERSVSASAEGMEAVQQTTQTMEAIREQVEDVAENIVTVSEKTQAISDIVTTVNEVAEQSNLLALNATIEAVSAGEQGSRFCVVANEMKSLADQAKRCTVQVRDILGEIQRGINKAVMLTEEAVKRVESGREKATVTQDTIRQVAETTSNSVQSFHQILAATNQQQIGLEQVTQGMDDIRVAAQQTATSTSQLNQAVSNLTALSRQLKSAVGSYQV